MSKRKYFTEEERILGAKAVQKAWYERTKPPLKPKPILQTREEKLEVKQIYNKIRRSNPANVEHDRLYSREYYNTNKDDPEFKKKLSDATIKSSLKDIRRYLLRCVKNLNAL